MGNACSNENVVNNDAISTRKLQDEEIANGSVKEVALVKSYLQINQLLGTTLRENQAQFVPQDNSSAVPYLPEIEMNRISKLTLAQNWMGRSRTSIHPAYRTAYDSIALVPEILERSSCLVAMQFLDERLSKAPISRKTNTHVVSEFVKVCRLSHHIKQSLLDLVNFSSEYGWDKYALAALRELSSRDSSFEQINIAMHDVHEFMQMCELSKMEAFVKVLDLVATKNIESISICLPTTPIQQVGNAVVRLREPIIRTMLNRRDRAFESVFIQPADFVLRNGASSNAHRQRADDLRVHGSNMYRALLLSVLGVNAWDTPDIDEYSHFAVDFLEYLKPDSAPLSEIWNPSSQRRTSRQNLQKKFYIKLDRAFIVGQNRPNGDVANYFNGPNCSKKEQKRVAQYAGAYAGFFSRDVLDIIVVNKVILGPDDATSSDSAHWAADLTMVLNALKALGVAEPEEECMNTFLYDNEYALRKENVGALMQFLGIYKITRQECAPLQNVMLVSPYKTK